MTTGDRPGTAGDPDDGWAAWATRPHAPAAPNAPRQTAAAEAPQAPAAAAAGARRLPARRAQPPSSRRGVVPGTQGRTGRRPGSEDTRGRILAAARTSFGEHGFDGTTVRGIAAAAGVDPALVHHYFGSKQQLFVAAMEIPVDFDAVAAAVMAGPPDEIGVRFVRYVLQLWETPAMRGLILGLVRSASTDEVAAAMLRRVLAEGPFFVLTRAIDLPDAPLRATLVGTQVVGLAMARYIVQVEPLASADVETVAKAVGPSIQRYLVGDLGAA